jgi:ASC-1-like (ASCH) protein
VVKLHNLKIYPFWFEAVLNGTKKYEIRKQDRQEFEEGDIVILNEWDQKAEIFTGRKIIKVVGYVCEYAQSDYHVVFSLCNLVDERGYQL